MWRHNSRRITSYDTDPEQINTQLQNLVQWLKDNPSINGCMDFNNLLFFLRACKHDLERTKKKIKRLVNMCIPVSPKSI